MRRARALSAHLHRFDDFAVHVAGRLGVRALRIALSIVFVWFGVLKIVGRSPVADLVADTLPFLPDGVAVAGMGWLEIVVGLGLLTGVAIRVVLGLFFLQMLGTFAVLVVQPGRSFDGPLALTVVGEFVVKNIVLLAAGLVVGAATIPPPRGRVGEMLAQRADTERETVPPPR